MGANVYTATFQNGVQVKRTSARPYEAAYRVSWVSGYDGQTWTETGFSRTWDLANAAADGQLSHVVNPPRGRRSWARKSWKAGQIVSREVVRTVIEHQITSKPRRTFQATFADGQTITRTAGVEFRFAVRVTVQGRPNHAERNTWIDWFQTEAKAQKTMADRIARHQDFYRTMTGPWAAPDFDCQATVEVVPARELKPLTDDERDGGARFEAVQNAGIDY